MGRFSAAKEKAPVATIPFISAKIRSVMNNTNDYIMTLGHDEQEKLLDWARLRANKRRKASSLYQKDLEDEMTLRMEEKRQKKEGIIRRKKEKVLKTIAIENLDKGCPDLSDKQRRDVKEIISGDVIERAICRLAYIMVSSSTQKCLYITPISSF